MPPCKTATLQQARFAGGGLACTLPCVTPSLAESTPHPEDTPSHDNPSMYIEEVEPDDNLYTQREITADPFDETQGPGTIFGSPPHNHSEIQDPQSRHDETLLLDNGFQDGSPAMPYGSTHPCLSSAMVPPLPRTFAALIVDPLPAPPVAHSIHMPCAAQCTLAPEPDRDLDDQAAPPAPLPLGDTLMTIAAALQRLTELVIANQHPADQKPKSQEPEMFDGSDPKKLQQFLVLLKLNFKEFKSDLCVNFGTFDPVRDAKD